MNKTGRQGRKKRRLKKKLRRRGRRGGGQRVGGLLRERMKWEQSLDREGGRSVGGRGNHDQDGRERREGPCRRKEVFEEMDVQKERLH